MLAVVWLSACGNASGSDTRAADAPGDSVTAVDDAGRTVALPHSARRVVSLLPAGTEMLFALGAGDRVVGRTRYDTDPRAAHLPSVGGGLDPSLEALISLDPDLVVAFETAGGSDVRARLEELGISVFAIQTQDTADIYRSIASFGRLMGRDAAADSLLGSIRAQLDTVRASVAGKPRPRAIYVAGIDPAIIAGRTTYIAELIGVAGGELVAGPGNGAVWPQVSLEELVRRQPDVVILPVAGDAAASLQRLREESGWRELAAVREGRIATVPVDLMNRPGPGIGRAARLLRDALHPPAALP